MSDTKKTKWLYTYDSEITHRLRGCSKYPTWEHLPAGHMRFAQGISPARAAQLYLKETKYGKQSCAVLDGARTKRAAAAKKRRK